MKGRKMVKLRKAKNQGTGPNSSPFGQSLRGHLN